MNCLLCFYGYTALYFGEQSTVKITQNWRFFSNEIFVVQNYKVCSEI